jgi:hypothetical protein
MNEQHNRVDNPPGLRNGRPRCGCFKTVLGKRGRQNPFVTSDIREVAFQMCRKFMVGIDLRDSVISSLRPPVRKGSRFCSPQVTELKELKMTLVRV